MSRLAQAWARSGLDRLPGGLLLIFILLLTAILYLPALDYPFIGLDDDYFVVHNPGIQDLSWGSVRHLFVSDRHDFRYYPLAYLSWALDHHFFGPDPFYFHLVNLLLHLANVALLFAFLRRLTHSPAAAALASLLFAIHPLQIESVVWVMQRRNVLFFFFFLLALLAYLAHRRRGDAGLRGATAALLATHVLFLLSVLSKTAAVTLPAVLLLIDLQRDAPARGQLLDFLRRRLPSKLAFLPVIVFAYVMTREAAQRSPFVTDYAYRSWEWLVIVGHNLFFYVAKACLPLRLGVFYPTPEPSALPAALPLYALGGMLLLGLLAWSWRRHEWIFWGLAYYVATLSPMLVITLFFSDLPMLAADRFFYQSAPGLFLVFGVGFERLWSRAFGLRAAALGASLMLALALLFTLSVQQRGTWRSTPVLFEHLLQHHPSDEFYYRLAFEYENAGEIELAYGALDRADRAEHRIFFTRLFHFQLRLADLYRRKGDLATAGRFVEGAIEATPNSIETEDARSPLAYFYAADLYERAGRGERAPELRRKAAAASVTAGLPFERSFLGMAPEEARAFLERHLAAHPEDGLAWWTLGGYYEDRGVEQRAQALRERAARLGFLP